jgi:hypothetical protein
MMISEWHRARFVRVFAAIWPDGLGKSATLGESRIFTDTVIFDLGRILREIGSSIEINIETNGKFAANNVRGLVIFNESTRDTSTASFTISPGIARLAKKPIYLGNSTSAENLLDALLIEIEKVGVKGADLVRN